MNKRKLLLTVSILTTGMFDSVAAEFHEPEIVSKTCLLDESDRRTVKIPPVDTEDEVGAQACVWSVDKEDLWKGKEIIVSDTRDRDYRSKLPNSFKHSDEDLNILSFYGEWENPGEHCFTTTTQIAYFMHEWSKAWGKRFGEHIALCMYANANSFGGANFFNGDFGQTAAAQEETEIKNFSGIYLRISQTSLVQRVVDSLGRETLCLKYKIPLYVAEPYRIRTILLSKHPMASYTALSKTKMSAVHGQKLPYYIKLPEPILTDVVFTAAPDWRRNPPIITGDYIGLFIQMLQTQMQVLDQSKAPTFITGPLGCGIFGNDLRVLGLAYAYVLRYNRPATLKNIVFIGKTGLYDWVKYYYNELKDYERRRIIREIPLCADFFLGEFFPMPEDREFLWPDWATKDPAMRKLFNIAIRNDEFVVKSYDDAKKILKETIGEPDGNFCLIHKGYICGRFLGVTILHAFAWARTPFIVVALCKEYGFNINYLNASGKTPLDVYVECCGCLDPARSALDPARSAYNTAKDGLVALRKAGAACAREENRVKLNRLLDYYWKENEKFASSLHQEELYIPFTPAPKDLTPKDSHLGERDSGRYGEVADDYDDYTDLRGRREVRGDREREKRNREQVERMLADCEWPELNAFKDIKEDEYTGDFRGIKIPFDDFQEAVGTVIEIEFPGGAPVGPFKMSSRYPGSSETCSNPQASRDFRLGRYDGYKLDF